MQLVFSLLSLLLIIYITTVVWVFWKSARPAIEYETILPTMPFTEVCPGQFYEFEVYFLARREKSVVTITENWVNIHDPRLTILDDTPEWRILPEPMEGHFLIYTKVPTRILPGRYQYLRAIGLGTPYILEKVVTVLPPEKCHGTP